MGSSARRAAASVSLLLLNATPAGATWTVAPDITVRETYTDNVFVGSSTRESDFVTQATPGLTINGAGRRFRANFRYNPSVLLYAHNSSENNVANNLLGQGTLEAVERFLFVDANAAVGQGFVSPLAPQPTDIVNVTANRTETRTFGISPYIRSQFGRAFTYELRNRNTWTRTDSSALADVRTSAWSASAASPTAQTRLLGWALTYQQNRTSYTTVERPDFESKLFRAQIFVQPTAELRLNANAGRESNNYALQKEQSYNIGGFGARWQPGPRTSAEAQYESRFFGPYRLLRFDHRTRLTAWNVTYSRDASTFQQQLLTLPPGNTAALLDAIFAARIADPVQRQAAVEQFLHATGTPACLANSLAFYTQEIFRQERLEGSLGVLGKRNTITFSAFRARSTRISSGVGTDLPDAFTPGSRITQTGFGANASHSITPFTTLGASVRRNLSRQEEPGATTSRNDFYAATLNHSLSPKTTTFAGLSYTHFDSSSASSSYRDARSAFVGLTHRF